MWMNLARGAKVLALVGFALPWLVVSCQDQEIASATGFELAVGRMRAAGDAVQSQSLDPAWWVVGMVVLILAGLVAGFLLKRRAGPLAAAVTAALALALGVWGMNGAVTEIAARAENADTGDAASAQLRSQITGLIHVEVRYGYWITILSLAGAAAAGLMATARPGARLKVVDAAP